MGLIDVAAEASRFAIAETSEILGFFDPLGIGRATIGAVLPGVAQIQTPSERTRMGLLSVALSAGARLLGIGAQAAPTLARGVVPQVTRIAGRAAQSPAARAALAAGLGGGAVATGFGVFGGDGAAPGGFPAAPGGGPQFVMTEDGSMVTISPQTGRPIRPDRLLLAGHKLPGGAKIVFISADRRLIGVKITRRRTPFSGEVRKVRRTIRGCQKVLAATKPRKRSD